MLSIDERESPDIFDAFLRLGVGVERKTLLLSDIVCGEVAIEHKSAEDFIASICDGRISEQVGDMEKSFQYPYLIIVGNPMLTLSRIHEHAVIGMMASIMVRTRVKIFRVDTVDDFAYLVMKLIEKHTDGKSFQTEKVVKRNALDTATRILSEIDGISLIKARAILEHFKTLRAVIDANKENSWKSRE